MTIEFDLQMLKDAAQALVEKSKGINSSDPVFLDYIADFKEICLAILAGDLEPPFDMDAFPHEFQYTKDGFDDPTNFEAAVTALYFAMDQELAASLAAEDYSAYGDGEEPNADPME